jgi:hypothetical protein
MNTAARTMTKAAAHTKRRSTTEAYACYHELEAGERSPSWETYERIAATFGCHRADTRHVPPPSRLLEGS